MRLRTLALIVTTSAAVTACGSSGHDSSAAANVPASRLLTESAQALRSSPSYELQGTISDNGSPTRLTMVIANRSDMEFSIGSSTGSVQMLVLPPSAYMRASRSFWTAQLGARGAAFANRWIEVPPSHVQALTGSLGSFAPNTLARCLVEDHGTLSRAGTTTVGGRKAIIIKDAGNAPGSNPGTLAVAATGRPYPLRIASTGPTRPGGTVDVCDDGKGGDVEGVITFSDYGTVKPLKTPSTVSQAPQPTSSI